jgi:demethylmenaquinone methyltransferase/2-methoxy-6-polyprenyl-1,4-benzoquinol methylase
MLREHLHRVVDEVLDLPRSLVGNERAALACRHVRSAHREMLLALRAVVGGALTCFDERPGEPLVRVEVEGESEVARRPATCSAAKEVVTSGSMEEKRTDLTPPYGYLACLFRPFPDVDPPFIWPVRQRAVELLKLQEGDRVLDMGCGLGGSFPYLVHAVGPSGQVVGVEISPVISTNSRRRIEKHGWRNVELIQADARTVHLTGEFDGLLLFATDVIFLEDALENIFPHLKDGARVVLFGAKTLSNRLGKIWNPVLRMLFNFTFSSTPRPDSFAEPWRMVAKRVEKLDIEECFFGLMWLASGSVARAKGHTNAGSAYPAAAVDGLPPP